MNENLALRLVIERLGAVERSTNLRAMYQKVQCPHRVGEWYGPEYIARVETLEVPIYGYRINGELIFLGDCPVCGRIFYYLPA